MTWCHANERTSVIVSRSGAICGFRVQAPALRHPEPLPDYLAVPKTLSSDWRTREAESKSLDVYPDPWAESRELSASARVFVPGGFTVPVGSCDSLSNSRF